jgi:hypothetical protein
LTLKQISDHVVVVVPECGCRLTVAFGKDGQAHLAHHGTCKSFPSCNPPTQAAKEAAQAVFDAAMPEALLLEA